MTKGRIAKYVANTALLAVLAAAGIGVYQLGTSGKDESVPEKVPSYYDESLSTENTTDNAVDAGTSLVEAELESNISTDHTSEKGMSQTEGEDAGSETTEAGSSSTESTFTSESILSAEQSTNENGTVNTSASVQEAPKLSFSEDTLMEWPVDGNILMDYNMDQTVYFPTLDQYKLSPAIAVQAVEGAPVLASVPGTVYSIEENAQTGTTVTMEIGSVHEKMVQKDELQKGQWRYRNLQKITIRQKSNKRMEFPIHKQLLCRTLDLLESNVPATVSQISSAAGSKYPTSLSASSTSSSSGNFRNMS